MRTLRLATPADAPQVAEIYAPIVDRTPISFELEAPAASEMGRRIAAVLGFAPWLVCTEGDAVLGYAYASRHHERAAYRWSVDLSLYVREGARRGGVGRALYRALLALLRLQGFRAAHAGITLPNAPSVGFHEALGFRPVGVFPRVGFKQGAWHDVGYWQLELGDRAGAPAEPLRVDELLRLPGVGEIVAGRGASSPPQGGSRPDGGTSG
jgi:L-amino acid N-acyltransferase YncA